MNCDMSKDIQRVLLTREEIQAKVEELGRRISQDYRGKRPVVICILKGAAIFFSDLVRAMSVPIEMDFMAISSYGAASLSSGVVQISKDLDISITGKDVLIVEDIMDSGLTLHYLRELLGARGPASLRLCCLLDKPERRKADIMPDYLGFTIPDAFVVGYGLDYAHNYRNLSYVGVLRPEIYS